MARDEYELVLSGKNIETSTKKGKGKVTLQVRRWHNRRFPAKEGPS